MELAVLDLGSTTFHLQHFEAAGAAGLASVLDVKRCTCLGAQVFACGYIDRRSRAEALAAVAELLALSKQRGSTALALVATSALRSARNGSSLAREIETLHDCSVEILTAHEEARLAYVGQLGWPVIGDRRFGMIDLGGGSVELSVGQQDQLLYTQSLPLGAVRLGAIAGDSRLGRFDKARFEALCEQLRDELAESMQAMASLAPALYVFGSGSARAARKLLLRNTQLPGKLGPLQTEQFERELRSLLGRSRDELIGLGVEPARAGSVLTAATVMLQILRLSGLSEAQVSDRGLRDGVAFELWRKLTRHSGFYRRSGCAAPEWPAEPSGVDAHSALR